MRPSEPLGSLRADILRKTVKTFEVRETFFASSKLHQS